MAEKLTKAQTEALTLLRMRARWWNPKSSHVAALLRRGMAQKVQATGQPYAMVSITPAGLSALKDYSNG